MGACFAFDPSNWSLPYKLEVWEWIVKRRIFDPRSQFPRSESPDRFSATPGIL